MTLRQRLEKENIINLHYRELVIDYNTQTIYLVYDKEHYVEEKLTEFDLDLPFWLEHNIDYKGVFKEWEMNGGALLSIEDDADIEEWDNEDDYKDFYFIDYTY